MNEKLPVTTAPKKPKFTPGPWRIGKTGNCVISDSSYGISIRGGAGDEAIKYYGGNLIGESISAGNAALIAIAPEMYSYLKKLKQYAPDDAREEIEKLLTRVNI